MTRLPPLDAHAHIAADVDGDDLDVLGAGIFAVTRSLSEATEALRRNDRMVVWGAGCHPGVSQAHRDFRLDTFAELIQMTCFVGELGLDGKSRVSLSTQQVTLRGALKLLSETPRIVSLHSYAAAGPLLDELESYPIKGAVLHWWLGDPILTNRAIEIGCYFSVNASAVRDQSLLDRIPLGRILPETDHPFGDRNGPAPRRPGNVRAVEEALASHHGVELDDVRRQVWHNLSSLVREVGCAHQLPRRLKTHLASLPADRV